jgi:hypothetical protein
MQQTLKEVSHALDIASGSQPGCFDLPALRCIHCGRQGILDTRGDRRILLCSSVLKRFQEYIEAQHKRWVDCSQEGLIRRISELRPVRATTLFSVPLKSFECTSAESDVVLYLWPKPESLAYLYS